MVKDENEYLSTDDFEGNLDMEIQLLYAMQGFKPVGVSKHFQMTCIIERLCEDNEKNFHAKTIWNHLNKLYDLQQLEDMESLPFPNPETDFSLPDSDFEQMKQAKIEAVKNAPPSVVEKVVATPAKSSVTVQAAKVKTEPSTPKEVPPKTQTNPPKESKKETVSSEKSSRGTPSRRDSFSSKDSSSSIPKSSGSTSKKDTNTPTSSKREEKKKESKSRSSSSNQKKDEEVKETKDSKDTKERIKEHITAKHREEQTVTKRTTRGSFRPEDTLQVLPDNFKSHSPLTVSSSSNTPSAKRRRI